MTIYDRISSIYDWLIISERPYRERVLKLLDIQHGEYVLDIGCGTGQTLPQLAAAVGKQGRVLGLDLSPGMLRQSQAKIEKRVGQSISLLRGRGQMLPLQAGTCDAILMSFTLELFSLEDQHHVLAEVRRVLKEDGRLGLLALSTSERTSALTIYQSLHEYFPAIIDCRPFDVVPLLAAGGFKVVRQENQLMFNLPLSILIAVRT
jgi:ubiquinone/menaquinone biosynthesis C-methylase UbiE